MKNFKVIVLTLLSVASLLVFGFSYKKYAQPDHYIKETPVKGCVFRTVMGEESSLDFDRYKTPEKILESVRDGLTWIETAQNQNGGWGAGSHSRQDIIDPHAVPSDPATTAMVSMALLRTGNTLRTGEQSESLRKGLQYLLNAVETSGEDNPTITNERDTQIQMKLGQNIDAILAAQFFSNVLEHANHDMDLKQRIRKSLDRCVKKIQKNQQQDGSIAGAGWAGVLQSAFAASALESAESNGIEVDKEALARSKDYQRKNFDAKTGEANTDMGAGVVLYSVTGSARATAKEARKIKEDVKAAKLDGRIPKDAKVNSQTLQVIGYSTSEATQGATTYEVYETAKVKAQQEDVLQGFGNNGGEEFLSYLQTGEGLVINKDESWQKWFDNISGRLLKIQNDNGSWNGHHCITSPVFCTATCLLILSINNDIEKLTDVGKQ
jgi:rhamnogalacturonyl hydrolase YesR